MRPLRRKPKQLTEEPTLHAAGSGGGAFRASPGRQPAAPKGTAKGSAVSGETDDPAALVRPSDRTPVDPLVRARARQIAARLALRPPRRDATTRRGAGQLASVPYAGGSDDVDLDRTLEVLAERPLPEDEDIVVRERLRTRRSVVLAVDVSGSMRGERVRTAAAAVGALAGELSRDALSVVAFWSDAAKLLDLGAAVHPLRLLDDLLQLPAQGLTNVSFPLEIAARELARVPVRDARVLLLSDCVHNAGPDPRHAAARLPRLDVLLDTTGEHDVELGRELARRGRGHLYRAHTFRDVAPALTAIFAQ